MNCHILQIRNSIVLIGGLLLMLFAGLGFCQRPVDRPPPATDTVTLLRLMQIPPALMQQYPDSAFMIASRSLEQSRQLNYSYGIGCSLKNLGLLEQYKGQYKKSIERFTEATDYFEKTAKGRREMPRMLSYIGNSYTYLGHPRLALHYQLKALVVANNFYPDINVDYIYNNLAAILSRTNRNPEVISFYLGQAERMAIQFKDYSMLAALNLNKGNNYLYARSFDSCDYYFRRAVIMGRASGDWSVEYAGLMNIGVLWLEKQQPDSALTYLLRAEKGTSFLPLAARKLFAGTLGRAYLFNNKPQEARPLIQKQYQDALDAKDTVSLRNAYYNMFLLMNKLGQYRAASRFAGDFITLDEKISGQAIFESVNDREIQYRSAEKEKDIIGKELRIARQEQEIATKNKWLALIIGGIAALSLLAILLRNRYRSRQELLQARLRDIEQSARIETLKATIQGEAQERIRIARELHDGLGAMTAAARINLGLLTGEQQGAASAEILDNTTQLLDEICADLRFTAHNMMPRALMEKDLPLAVSTFCEYVGRKKPFGIQVQVLGSFRTLPEIYLLSAYRMVQELVHNAEKHAHASHILVQLSYRDNLLSLTVEDDGQGFDSGAVKLANGLGLDSIRGRAESLGGILSIDSTPGSGTSITIDIPTTDELAEVSAMA